MDKQSDSDLLNQATIAHAQRTMEELRETIKLAEKHKAELMAIRKSLDAQNNAVGHRRSQFIELANAHIQKLDTLFGEKQARAESAGLWSMGINLMVVTLLFCGGGWIISRNLNFLDEFRQKARDISLSIEQVETEGARTNKEVKEEVREISEQVLKLVERNRSKKEK